MRASGSATAENERGFFYRLLLLLVVVVVVVVVVVRCDEQAII